MLIAIMMTIADVLREIFSDPSWRVFSTTSTGSPNQHYFREKNGKKIGAVVVLRKANGRGEDFALSKVALDRAVKALAEGRLDAAFVVLGRREADGSLTPIAGETVPVVQEQLRNVPTIAGKYGEYWWIDRTFNAPRRVGDEDLY